MKKLHAWELSRNESILCCDIILQNDWPIEQCLLHNRVFLGGKTNSPRSDLFIHWLIKQITNTYRRRNHFSRSYEIRSKVDLIHGTGHLCTRLGTDGMKATSRGFTGGQTNLGRVCLFLDNRKWNGTFYLKDDHCKLWVEMIVLIFWIRWVKNSSNRKIESARHNTKGPPRRCAHSKQSCETCPNSTCTFC